MGLIFPDSQNELVSRKLEVEGLQDSNSNSFEFNSNGLNQDQVFEVPQNVEILGGARENDERIYGQNLRTKLEVEKT